jgi:hypothetical protein
MLLGLGRGPPGRGPPVLDRSPGRPAGRGPPGPAGPAAEPGGTWPGAVRGVAPMPVAVELKGLLPGRGPGRGPGRWPGPPGRGPAEPGRGAAGRGAASRLAGCLGSAGRAWPDPAPGTNGSLGNGAGTCGCGATAGGVTDGDATDGGATDGGAADGGAAVSGTTGCGAACSRRTSGRTGACTSATAPARPFAVCRSAAGAAPSLAAFAWLANSSFSLRTTGASMVEDADRTNSPISWSLAITALLSTPNSFASS